MKKIFCSACVIILIISACGCTTSEKVYINMDDFASYLLQNIKFEDELTKLDDDMISNIYDIEEGVTASVYVGSGATAEEIAIFKTLNNNNAKKVKEAITDHIKKQKDSFSSYMPLELKKLNNAVIIEKAPYIILLISNESDVKSIIEKYNKE